MPMLLGFVLLAGLLAGRSEPSPAPQPSAARSNSAEPSPAPAATLSPAPAPTPAVPSATPSAAGSPTPAGSGSPTPPAGATPTPLYKFVYRATPAPSVAPSGGTNAPSIDEIDLNDSTIVTPGALHLRVLTSDAVVSVTAETLGRSVTIPLRQRGTFAYDGFIPAVPFFLRNQTYDVRFVASAQDGRTALVTLPLTLK